MSETDTEAPEGQVRTFWPTDYRRFAGIVRQTRKTHGDEKANALAAVITEQLSADSPEFDAAKFTAGTIEQPAYVGALAKTLKQARHVKCQPYTAKDPEHMAKVDAMAAALAGVLAGGEGFVPETFHGSTQLQSVPTYGYTEDGPEDEDPDYS